MRVPRQRPHHKQLLIGILAAFALFWLAGCSIHEQRNGEKGDKKVEIKTPFGDLKVNTEVDVKETGLPVYPGARQAARDQNDSKSANVNISVGSFGLKVVAVKFESDDAPDKVLAFYRDKVKAYGGKYLECHGLDINVNAGDSDEKELTCGKHGDRGDSTELKGGTPGRQHIVSVKAKGSGSEFALVYVNKRGKEGEL